MAPEAFAGRKPEEARMDGADVTNAAALVHHGHGFIRAAQQMLEDRVGEVDTGNEVEQRILDPSLMRETNRSVVAGAVHEDQPLAVHFDHVHVCGLRRLPRKCSLAYPWVLHEIAHMQNHALPIRDQHANARPPMRHPILPRGARALIVDTVCRRVLHENTDAPRFASRIWGRRVVTAMAWTLQ